MLNVTSAWQSLWEQRSRAALSALGILVASVAIVLLVSIAIGVRADVTSQVKDLGVNTLVVLPARIEGMGFNPNLGGQSFLKEEDATRLRSVPGVLRTAPLTFAGGGVRAGKKEAFPIVIAATSEWFAMQPNQLREGQFWTDPNSTERVAVLGSLAADALFGEGQPAVGKQVTINQRPYRVVAVTQDQKSEQSLFSMGGFQNVVYVPYHAAKAANPTQQTDRIMVQSAPDAEPKALVKALDQILAQRLDRQQFSVLTQEDLLGLVYQLMSILTWLLTGLTSIALFVGGVGILTVMLMSVNERAREIGVRKTVGARRGDIFQQFLVESATLALIGGTLGFALSYVVCLALYHFTPVKPMVTPGVAALCFGVCLGVGTIFGVWPALRAARQDPVVALRHE